MEGSDPTAESMNSYPISFSIFLSRKPNPTEIPEEKNK